MKSGQSVCTCNSRACPFILLFLKARKKKKSERDPMSPNWAEGESEKGAMEELRRRGREVGEVLAGKRMVQRKMAARLGGSVDATPEEKDETEPNVTSVQMEVRVAGEGRKSGHFVEDQNNKKGAYSQNFKKQFEARAIINEWNIKARNGRCSVSSRESQDGGTTTEQAAAETRPLDHRDRVKAGRYNGRISWEAYQAKFQMVAQAYGWNQAEKAVQLAAALEGEALRALLVLSDEELTDCQAVVTALDHRFGGTEPATSLCQRLASRNRSPGEKVGMFAAKIHYLTRKGYPHFTTEVQEDLATEANSRCSKPPR
ncbi:UNVERIFIED_CONTAM: hypothetical protein FKN15_040987 [Acipenser sinensis]